MPLTIRHVTTYTYEPAAAQAALRLMLFPPESPSQIPLNWAVRVNGTPINEIHTDASRNAVGLWHQHSATEAVEIIAEGTIETTNSLGVLGGPPEAARPAVYRRETPLTKSSEAIREMAAKVTETEDLPRLHALSDLVHKAIDYRSGVTSSGTTAAEAMTLGAGVCQDQTHVFIAAARALDIPARYITGYLYDPDDPESQDQTHAWAEAHVSGLGWVGFDITNEICPTENYVRLCSGLDAADAAPIRGVTLGDTEETIAIEVAISQATSQSQQ